MRPSTIADVAARAGVSTATVSRVLSGTANARPETRDRVLAAAHDLGYRPSGVARSLKLRRTGAVGVIITDIENPFFAEIVRAVEDAARELGYVLLLCNGADDPERETAYLEILAARRVDGIIIATGGVGLRHARWLEHAPVPVVMVNCEAPVPGVPAVLSDDQAGGRLAAEHLIRLGHRVLGHLTVPAVHAAAAPRLGGIVDALGIWGLSRRRLTVAEGDGHVTGGERAMGDLLVRSPDVTGVVCYNDLTAIGALRALRAHGRRVPEDVSVVGFDDLDLAAYVDPPLTTVAQDTATMGRWALQRVVGLMRSEPPDVSRAAPAPVVRLPVRLVDRASAGPVPTARRTRTTAG